MQRQRGRESLPTCCENEIVAWKEGRGEENGFQSLMSPSSSFSLFGASEQSWREDKEKGEKTLYKKGRGSRQQTLSFLGRRQQENISHIAVFLQIMTLM